MNGQFKENGFVGGVHIGNSPKEVMELAKMMCGKTLVCPESGADGFLTKCVYIMEELEID